MKNWLKLYWGNYLSIIAILLSITALCRCEPFEFTDSWLVWSIGISTTILAMAVASAIAIQVYNSVVSESKIKRIIDEKVADNKKHLEEVIEDARQEFISLLYIVQSQSLLMEKEYESSFDRLMRALTHAKGCNCKTAYNTAIKGLENFIAIIEDDKIDISIDTGQMLWYKDEVNKINDKRIMKIEKFINEVQTRPPVIPKEIQEMLEPFVKKDE